MAHLRFGLVWFVDFVGCLCFGLFRVAFRGDVWRPCGTSDSVFLVLAFCDTGMVLSWVRVPGGGSTRFDLFD